MKKILLLFVFVAFSSMMNAQTATPAVTSKMETTAKPKVKQTANTAAYACMKCYHIEKTGGKCSKCQGDKVQLGTYYCAHCMKATGTKAGKCDMCGGATTQMTRKLCASKTMKTPVTPKKAA